MDPFEKIVLAFRPEDYQRSMEDDFFIAKIVQGSKKIEQKEELVEIIEKLAELAAQRQGLIRGLCKRLADLEVSNIKNGPPTES